MRVLVIGSGGREHALAWKLRQSPLCQELYVWPGNICSQRVGKRLDLPENANYEHLAASALDAKIDLVVVGPEGPLSSGIADILTARGLKVFGPTQKAAQLESSKVFAKRIMMEAGIPTAAFEVATSKDECYDRAMQILNRDGGVVLKASGLASGKGVFVCHNEDDVNKGLDRLFEPTMRAASDQIVVEEMLFGREVSFFCFLGKGGVSRIGFAVDHKRLRAGDKGPNTGGMGCYTPVPWLPGDAAEQVDSLIVEPLLKTLSKNGIEYTGCLYVGLMWSDKGPSVVEFNVRLGDPEAQVLALSDRTDWLPIMAAKVGTVTKRETHYQSPLPVIGYVMASSGYPFGEQPDVDQVLPLDLIEDTSDGAMVFCASVKSASSGIKTGSGRVFLIAASGQTFNAAKDKALGRIGKISGLWPQAQWRSDIGQSVLQYEDAVQSSVVRCPIVLGSSSPRRRELLGHLGLNFTVMKPLTEETPRQGESAADYVARNAYEKNEWICEQVAASHPQGIVVISADTIVVIDGKILEKPLSPADAKGMLSQLSGRLHTVLTAVRIASVNPSGIQKHKEFTVATDVLIKKLSGKEMDGYIATGEPFDKAGGYAAQGLGSFMVQEVRGSFSNVVGLPLAEVADSLQTDFGIPLWRDR
jgi:phosphoribosylamine--glycine ligase